MPNNNQQGGNTKPDQQSQAPGQGGGQGNPKPGGGGQGGGQGNPKPGGGQGGGQGNPKPGGGEQGGLR